VHERGPEHRHAEDRSGDEAYRLRDQPQPEKGHNEPDQRPEREEEQEEGNGEKLPGESQSGQHGPEDYVQIFQALRLLDQILYQPRQDRRSPTGDARCTGAR
jgi:hypothetical protein